MTDISKTTSPGENGTDSAILTHGERPWHDLDAVPGEFVLRFENSSPGFCQENSFAYCVKRFIPRNPDGSDGSPQFLAATPYRHCVAIGNTTDEAVSLLMRWVAEMSRNGSLNPQRPCEPGDPPIQHVLGILSERMQWQIDRRHEHIVRADPEVPRLVDENKSERDAYLASASRDNEIISALATSIAALARVKDL